MYQTCGLLEENNKYTKAEISRLHTDIFRLHQVVADERANVNKDANGMYEIMEEQVRIMN